jgi:hypothetical protein
VVSRRRRGEQIAGIQRTTQSRDMDVQCLDRAGGRLVAPQGLRQTLGADGSVGVQQQEREQRPRLPAAELDDAIAGARFDGTENRELHRDVRRTVPRRRARTAGPVRRRRAPRP